MEPIKHMTSTFAYSPEKKQRLEHQTKVYGDISYNYFKSMTLPIKNGKSADVNDKSVDAIDYKGIMNHEEKRIKDAILIDKALLEKKAKSWTPINFIKVAAKVAAFVLSLSLAGMTILTLLPVTLTMPQTGAILGVGAGYGLYKFLEAKINELKDFEEVELEADIKNFEYALQGFASEKLFKETLGIDKDSKNAEKKITEFHSGLDSELTKVREKISRQTWEGVKKKLHQQMGDPARAKESAILWQAAAHIEHYIDYVDFETQLINAETTNNSVAPTVDEMIEFLMKKSPVSDES